MAAPNDGYSRNAVPLMGPTARVTSNLSGGRGAPNDVMAQPTPQAKGADQEFVSNGVPLESAPQAPGGDWLQLARENHMVAQNYFDISIRRRVEDNIAHASSRHASGSRYYDPAYDKRAKYFDPKTRAMMRKHEAACAIAFFSTMDVVNCQALDNDNPDQVEAAEIHTELLNYRLRQSLPWFKILLGAHLAAMVENVVISCQEWRYREAVIVDDEYDELDQPTGRSKSTPKVTQDMPWVRICPIENILMHPSCDWLDPINSSPYLIEKIPYFINELADRIKNACEFGSQVPYLQQFTVQQLMAGATDQDNSSSSLRMQREQSRLDRFSQVQQGTKFKIVWVHRNIVRIDGQDLVYETLGTTLLLSNPVPIDQVFGIDRRPYVMGSCTIEPHRPYPSGPVEMVKPTQEMLNELRNQRTDNIRLALNQRYIAKRGAMVDYRSLMRNVPGSITLSTDPTGDVRLMETKDVTGSAFQEQDRLNLGFDDLAGNFTQSTVGAARNLNERVKGMELMGQGADMVTELELRTLSETWVQPVLNQLVDLERAFESDSVVLGIVGARTQTGNWMNAFRLLQHPTNCTVAVGFGNTDPMQRVQRLSMAWQTVEQGAPAVAAQSDQTEFAREVMGALGYQDGARFFPSLKKTGQDPQVQALQQQIQQLQGQVDSEKQRWDTMIKVAQIRADNAKEIAQIKAQSDQNKVLADQAARHYVAGMQGQIKQIDQQIAQEKNVIAQGNLLLEREALSNAIMQADREFQLQVATSLGTPLPAQPQVPMPDDSAFVNELQSPTSQSVVAMQTPHQGQQPKLPGADPAGVIQRGRFGMVPGARG